MFGRCESSISVSMGYISEAKIGVALEHQGGFPGTFANHALLFLSFMLHVWPETFASSFISKTVVIIKNANKTNSLQLLWGNLPLPLKYDTYKFASSFFMAIPRGGAWSSYSLQITLPASELWTFPPQQKMEQILTSCFVLIKNAQYPTKSGLSKSVSSKSKS